MKKFFRLIALCAALCLLLSMSALAAEGGSQDDPVISYSYLTTTLHDSLLQDAFAVVDAGSSAAFTAFAEEAARLNREHALQNVTPVYVKGRVLLKSGDILTLSPGAQATLLAGAASANSANLVDITAGTKQPSGAALVTDHRYMKNDQSDGGLSILSETAEVFLDGVVSLAYSSATDYASMADAMYEMGLFAGTRGATTGYALEHTCTRIESLIMFLRLIGVEQEAAAFTGTHPFTDVPQGHWAYRYLAYAYAHNLAYGTSKTTFTPSRNVTAQEYLTFLLRCLHYREGTDFTYNTVLNDASQLGAFSAGEISRMNSGTFYRSRMVYLSYYALYATEQNSQKTLLLSLVDAGAVNLDNAISGAARVNGSRVR